MAIDFKKPLRTKEGRPVTIVTTEGRGDYPIIGYVGDSNSLTGWSAEGKYAISLTDAKDLENVPEEVVRYANVYLGYIGNFYGSIREAVTGSGPLTIGRLKLTLSEDCKKLLKAEVL